MSIITLPLKPLVLGEKYLELPFSEEELQPKSVDLKIDSADSNLLLDTEIKWYMNPQTKEIYTYVTLNNVKHRLPIQNYLTELPYNATIAFINFDNHDLRRGNLLYQP